MLLSIQKLTRTRLKLAFSDKIQVQDIGYVIRILYLLGIAAFSERFLCGLFSLEREKPGNVSAFEIRLSN